MQPESAPALTDTVVIKRKDRRVEQLEERQRDLPKVPESLLGRVICAHPEIVTAVCALGMFATFMMPPEMLTVSATLGVLGFSWGWASLLHLPYLRGSRILILLFGLLAVLLGRIFGDLAVVTQLVGLGIIGAFIAEMSRFPRSNLINSVAGNLSGIFIVSTAGVWVVLEHLERWYFLLLPAALILLGGCVGMSLSANWQSRWRAVASIVGSALFGFAAGMGAINLQGPAREQLILFAGGQPPRLGVVIMCGVGLGLVIGVTFAVLNMMFTNQLAPVTVGAAVAQGLIPVLSSAVPIYILGRLVVGQGLGISM